MENTLLQMFYQLKSVVGLFISVVKLSVGINIALSLDPRS